jgi:DNA-binding transcriptional MerR regulator
MENRVYWANEIAEIVGVSRSTLRKWSISLEQVGYAFVRDENNRRCYVERDIAVLRKMKVMLDGGMTMENGARVGIALEKPKGEKEEGIASSLVTIGVHGQSKRSEECYLELVTQNQEIKVVLEQLVQQMEKQQSELELQLGKQQAYIEKSLERRDEQLMIVLREITKAKKEASAAKKWWQNLI